MSRLEKYQAIIEAVKAGNPLERDQGCKKLYIELLHCKKSIAIYLKSNSGRKIDVDDLYQEAFLILIDLIRQDRLVLTSAGVEPILMGIVRNLWRNIIRKKREIFFEHGQENLEDEVELLTPEIQSIRIEIDDTINQIMGQIGGKCRLLLKLWALSFSMKEIARIVGLKRERRAINRRYECLKRLKTLVAQTGQEELMALKENLQILRSYKFSGESSLLKFEDFQILQKSFCKEHGLDWYQLPRGLQVSVSTNFFASDLFPINGIRTSNSEDNSSAWYLWRGNLEQKELHRSQLTEIDLLVRRHPEVIKFLGMGPGSRFSFCSDGTVEVFRRSI